MSKGYTLRYSIIQFGNEKNGIGESKHEAKKIHGGRSPKFHSFGTKTRYFGVINNFVEKMYKKSIKRVNHVRGEDLIEFLEEKASRTTRNTMRTNMAALRKFFQSSAWREKNDLLEAIDKKYYYILDLAMESGEAKPFTNPERVIEKMKQVQNKTIASIQLLTGARIDDVPKVVENLRNWKEGQDLIIRINKSKGGRNRTLDFNDRKEKFEKVRQAIATLVIFIDEKGWKKVKEDYYPDLEDAVSALQESYTGSHSFRVNYAQRRFQELIEKGLSEKEALKIITKELGHNRIRMAKSYVSR